MTPPPLPISNSSPQMRRNIVPIRPRSPLPLIGLERPSTLRSRNSLNVFPNRALTRLHRVPRWWSGRLARWCDLELLRRGHVTVRAKLWSWNQGEFRKLRGSGWARRGLSQWVEPGSPATKSQDGASVAVLRLVESPGSLAHKTRALVWMAYAA